MSDYVYISNYQKNGRLAISRRVFEELSNEAVARVSEASLAKKGSGKSKVEKLYFKLYRPVVVTFHKNGQVEVKVSITIKKGANAEATCLRVQEEIAASLLAYTESIPFNVNIKIAKIA